MTVVAIHQPQYLPWIPFFQKINCADYFVYLDNVQYQKRGLQNRNQVKGPDGPVWLSVPVSAHRGDLISAIRIASTKWQHKHTKTIEQYYAKAPHLPLYESLVKPVITKEFACLADLNRALTQVFIDFFAIKTRIVSASSLDVSGRKQELIINICRELDASVYLSGNGARDYQCPEIFREHGIDLEYHVAQFDTYEQCHSTAGFTPGLSALDALLNLGEEALMLVNRK